MYEHEANTRGSRADRSVSVVPDLRTIIDCLLAAQYTQDEIFDYLTGPLGLSEAEAAAAVLNRAS